MALPQCPQRTLTNQLEFLSKKVLPLLMRHPNAKAFLKPVDYIAYGLPDYPNIIKCPIDLNTIRDRLNRKFYATSRECIHDLNLMFQNSYVYNKPGDIIVRNGLQLETEMSLKLKLMPNDEFKLVKSLKTHNLPLTKKKMPHKIPKLAFKAITNEEADTEIAKPEKPQTPRLHQTSPDSDKCLTLLNELMSHKYKLTNYLFLKPVDVKSLGLSDYFDVVKCPMDLGSIKHSLDTGIYDDNRTAFVNDIYLMINNCLNYNGINSEIGLVCKHFQSDFETLFLGIFKEKCQDNVHDDAVYFLTRIMRRHREIEDMIRINGDKIAHSRHRIDMIVNILEDSNIVDKKRKKKEITNDFQ